LPYNIVVVFDVGDGVGCCGACKRAVKIILKDGGFQLFYPRGVFVETGKVPTGAIVTA
jgi:hypothetical protein